MNLTLKFHRVIIIFLLLLSAATLARQPQSNLIRVPEDYPSIQAGINAAADGDTVLVADRIYYENINFKGKAITVASYFIMSGDTNHIANTVINGSQPSNPDSGSVVYFISGEDTNSVLCGFTVTGGSGTIIPTVVFPPENLVGAGILCSNDATPTISYNIIENNTLDSGNQRGALGAGIYINTNTNNATAIITGNYIRNNLISCMDHFGGGGGIAGFSSARIKENQIIANEVLYVGGTGSGPTGGGIILRGISTGSISVLVENNVIANNASNSSGGPAWCGALDLRYASLTLTNNDIVNNSIVTSLGGSGSAMRFALANGIHMEGNRIAYNNAMNSPNISGVVLVFETDNVTIKNNIFEGNSATWAGAIDDFNTENVLIENNILIGNIAISQAGGIWTNSRTQILNNTIVNNISATGGGIYIEGAQAIVLNSILWGNTNNQIFPAGVEVRYSDIQGGWPGEGNIDANPFFADTVDYQLSDSSLCIGAGIDSIGIGGIWYYAPPTDIGGNPRPNPSNCSPDIGAWESVLCSPILGQGAQIGVTPVSIDFGILGLGAPAVSKTIVIQSLGTADLTISAISDPGGLYTLSNVPTLPVVIPPGGMETFEVVFTPSDTGRFDATITLTSDDANDPTLDISLTAEVVLAGQNVKLISHLNDYPNIGYTDCWGYTAPNGREYALLGVRAGVSIVDVTDSSSVAEVDFVPFVNSIWYDIKTYQNYMYVCSEGSLSILIVDLSPLPDSASVIGTFSGLTSGPHNIFIDTETALLYVVEDLHYNPAVRIFSLADPENPLQVSTINPSNNGTDSHDVFAQDSVLYIAEGNNPSIGIYDMSDPANPTLLRRLNIPAAGYVHQVWVSEDNHYMVATEETPNKTVKVWDIQDLNNITLVSEYLGESHLAHNAYIKGDYVYISHYESGLKVLDFSDPTNVSEYGFYDTYLPANSPNFNGAWGVYPFTSNGMIFISDIQSGLYVLQLEGVVGIEDEKPGLPERFSLEQNYPNPFNPSTTISFQVAQSGNVRIEIYNILGQKVRTLLNDRKDPGAYQVVWDGRNDNGAQVGSGIYLYRLVARGFVRVRKMILMK